MKTMNEIRETTPQNETYINYDRNEIRKVTETKNSEKWKITGKYKAKNKKKIEVNTRNENKIARVKG